MTELAIGLSGGGTAGTTGTEARNSLGLGVNDTVTHFSLKVIDGAAVAPSIAFTNGTDTGLFLQATGVISMVAGGVECLRGKAVGSAVNCFALTPAIAGNPPTLSVEGTDTNISFLFSAKGTGRIQTNAVGGQVLGGFASGGFHVTSTSADANANAVITGHNLFGGNKQLWYLGSAASANDDILFINRQSGSMSFLTSNALAVKIEADGDVVFEKKIQIKGGVPDAGKVLTSDAVGVATWQVALGGGWTDDGANVRLNTSTDKVGIGISSATGKLHVDQTSATGAIPVLILDQGDDSEEMIEFIGTIGVGNALEAVGAKTLTTTHFVKISLPGALTRYLQAGTIS